MTPTPETHPDWPCWPIDPAPVVEEQSDPLDIDAGFDANEDQSPMGII